MRYRYNVYTGVKKIKTKTAIALSALGLVLGAGGLSLTIFSSASAATPTNLNNCFFAESGNNWTLQSDCSSSAQIDVPAGVTLDGGGYTISPTFSKDGNSDNAALGVLGDNVTIENLTVNGVGGVNLHGINVYEATNVVLSGVTSQNNQHNGIVVNGSTVTVNNITTKNNGWGGIDVDQGSGVTTPAVLTVNGTSTQTEAGGVDIYVDDTGRNVSVIDTNSQYFVTDNVFQPGDAVYTLKGQAKDMCMHGGWSTGLYVNLPE